METERAKNLVILLLAGSTLFLAGLQFNVLESQGVPGRRLPVKPAPRKAPPPATQVLPTSSARFSSGAANADMIAVTGDYGVGTSVLYVIDTKTKVLSVYEARGGAKSSRRVVWVGARKIDLDLQTESYNDDSEVSYGQLRAIFQKKGLLPGGSSPLKGSKGPGGD